MKISYYDAFDLIAEDAVEILSGYDWSQESADAFTAQATISSVLEDVGQDLEKPSGKTGKSPKSLWKIRLLIAAIILLGASSVSIAIRKVILPKDGGAVLVDDSNKSIIGKEIVGIPVVVDTQGKITNIEELKEAYGEPFDFITDYSELEEWRNRERDWKDNTIITSAEEDAYVPNMIDGFETQEENGTYTTPEIMLKNGAMAIFTKENGLGWELKKGDILRIQIEEYPTETRGDNGQAIGYAYILNGTLMARMDSLHDLQQEYELQAEEDGEYYIGLIGASSDNITLRQGKIDIK